LVTEAAELGPSDGNEAEESKKDSPVFDKAKSVDELVVELKDTLVRKGYQKPSSGYPTLPAPRRDMLDATSSARTDTPTGPSMSKKAGRESKSIDQGTRGTEKAQEEAVDLASALMLGSAAALGNTRQVQRLLDAKVAPDVADDGGTAPLEKAATSGHFETVKLLLNRKADPSGVPDSKSTPLHRAAAGGHAAIITLLLERGANPARSDAAGRKPKVLAMDNKTRNCFPDC